MSRYLYGSYRSFSLFHTLEWKFCGGFFFCFFFFSMVRMHWDYISSLAVERRRGKTLHLSLLNFTKSLSGPSIHLVEVPLPRSPVLQHIALFLQFGSTRKLVEDVLSSMLQLKMLNTVRPLWNTTANQLPAGLRTTDHYALSPVVQPGFTATAVHSSHPLHMAPARIPAWH